MKTYYLSLILICIIFLPASCTMQGKVGKFIAQYEFEDFSQFNGTQVFIRSYSNPDRNPTVFVNAQHLIQDSTTVGPYAIELGKNNQVLHRGWIKTDPMDADTVELTKLAKSFINYKISRLNVDSVGNVFIYMKDADVLSLVKFADELECPQSFKSPQWHRIRWKRIKGNWYIPKKIPSKKINNPKF